MFFCKIRKIFKKTFVYRTSTVAASVFETGENLDVWKLRVVPFSLRKFVVQQIESRDKIVEHC